MKKYIIILFAFISSLAYSQYDFQELCIACAEQNGFYCGDDPANWTQYSPDGCVPNGLNDMFYLNDGWEDCIDGSDEAEAVPTTIEDCAIYGGGCERYHRISRRNEQENRLKICNSDR